jgi:uncharacterized repeat protein (TIGR03843 family)
MDPGRSSETHPVEEALRTLPQMELLGVLRRSSNYTFLARLGQDCPAPEPAAGGETAQEDLLAVYKPARGESPLWDFPAGTLYGREVAAYRLARALGWPRVPPTVVREDAPHGIGAVQLFVASRPDQHYLVAEDIAEECWLEVAAFDVICNNADRKSGHCLIDQGSEVWAIDHGLTFHVDQKLRTVIWDFAGHPAPERLRDDLEQVAGALAGGELSDQLSELISRQEIAALRRRVEEVLRPSWRFPHPASSWSVPWPPV